jgi:endoglucanase
MSTVRFEALHARGQTQFDHNLRSRAQARRLSVKNVDMRSAKFLTLIFLLQVCSLGEGAWAEQTENAVRGINATAWYTWPRFNGFDKPGVFWPPFPPNRQMPSTYDFENMKSLGFSSVRLGVDPALFMGLEEQKKGEIKSQIMLTVQQALDTGIDVDFDLHPNSKHKIYGQSAYVDFDIDTVSAYVKMTGEVAEALAVFPKGRVALELMNEPRMKCTGADLAGWQNMLDAMIAETTRTAPDVPLVVSGACASSIEGLLALTPGRWKRKDINFTFHFYEPFPFTHQSAPFIAWPEKYLTGLPWPPRANMDKNAIVASAELKVSKLPQDAQAKAEQGATAVLDKYLSSGAGRDSIRQRLQLVADWADKNDVARRSINMGEFGVYIGDGEWKGAKCEDRAAWVNDVRSIADELGFSWSYFHIDGPFGVLVGPSRQPDLAVLKALGLRSEGSCHADQ